MLTKLCAKKSKYKVPTLLGLNPTPTNQESNTKLVEYIILLDRMNHLLFMNIVT